MPHNYPLDKLEPGLNENAFYDPTNFTFPAGSYVCEVEVDRTPAWSKIVGFTAVDDFGKVINPMIVEGQVHGGLAQGIGQALIEGCGYDDSGPAPHRLVHGLLHAARRRHCRSFKVDTRETPCTHNPLGVKGCGEAGAIGAPAAVMNADHRRARRQGPADAGDAARSGRRSNRRKRPRRRRPCTHSNITARRRTNDALPHLGKKDDASYLAGGQSLIGR